MRVFIVGGTSGIGYSVAKALTEKGHEVIIGVHRENQIKVVNNKLKNDHLKMKVYKLDVRNKIDRNLVKKINIDCLMVHDSIGNGGSILEMDIDILRDTYETNIFGNFSLVKDFYQFKTSKNEKAKIFITSSMASMIPIPYLGCYTSSKAAMTMLCQTIYYELKYINPNISISVIEPTAYHTGFNQIMIDNKDININHKSKTYKHQQKINQLQRNIFRLIEKDNWDHLTKQIVKEMEKEKPKLKIGRPFFQILMIKIYLFIFR